MTGRRRTGAAVLVLAFLTGGPALAAPSPSPSPSPDDRSTSLSTSPGALSARETLTLKGFSDCAIIDGHLVFTGYDGNPDNVVVRSQQSRYDTAREKYPYQVRIVVPARARPGSAQVYAEPFCGPPEDYPPSDVQRIRLVPAALNVTRSPRRPTEGRRLQLSARSCNGPGSRLTFAVAVDGVSERVTVAVSGDGRATLTYDLPRRAGPATVSLPSAASQCPGSSAPGVLAFTVRAVPTPAPAATETVSPSPSASTTSAAAVAPVPFPTRVNDGPAAARTRPRRDRGPAVVLVLLAGALALGGGAAVWWSRRRGS